jgi:hypothetical protein
MLACRQTFVTWLYSLTLVFILVVHPSLGLSQDRQPGSTQNYPTAAKIQNRGNVYNLKDPPPANPLRPGFTPVAAVGDGNANDTQAFKDAYDYVLMLMDNGRPLTSDEIVKSPAGNYIIYIPNGTYKVTNTITYSGNTRYLPDNEFRQELTASIRFIGESRAGSIIRLANGSNGFNNPASPKVVLAFSRPAFPSVKRSQAETNTFICSKPVDSRS